MINDASQIEEGGKEHETYRRLSCNNVHDKDPFTTCSTDFMIFL